MFSMFPILFIVSMRHLRIRYGMLMQQRMLRRRQMTEMMNLMRYGTSGAGAVTMHDRHRMAFVRWLLAVRQSATHARHFRPPDPRGGHDAGAEGQHQSQDEELQHGSSGNTRCRGRFRCSEPRFSPPPFVKSCAGEADDQSGVETGEYTDADQQLFLSPMYLGRGRFTGGYLALLTHQQWIRSVG